WRDLGNRVLAAEAFAWAWGLDPDNGFHENHFKMFMREWLQWAGAHQPPGFPDLTVGKPSGYRFFPDTLHEDYEQDILALTAVERLLCQPDVQNVWEQMRRGEWKGRGPNRAVVEYRPDGTSTLSLELKA